MLEILFYLVSAIYVLGILAFALLIWVGIPYFIYKLITNKKVRDMTKEEAKGSLKDGLYLFFSRIGRFF